MNIAYYYRVLGLKPGASFAEVKASYRRLARVCHPDVNPGDRRAKDKFIQLTQAYEILLKEISEVTDTELGFEAFSHPPPEPMVTDTPSPAPPPRKVKIPPLSPQDQQLKQSSYEQLRELLKNKRFPRAIALVEALRDRLPFDPEVRQWQAITYQSQGQHLLKHNQLEKAQLYLQKARRTDPHNRRLGLEIERDLNRLGIESTLY
ncbi:DnaJ domain-containing protein [Roseofilum sp. BLCC_M91]|uniref:DnaJ domain-containing protein n=1 Tax=Roseofilum halophilum BLCC-M91 TaxID=3022259 RepID=A0ABT7BJP3_9CYAN|nr:DnaJ domain-containing protein [Roseofilum halophilum]MDJ1179356.1 DnaJ domain-containing protein [Roseofilum halophilum BLCC-M91]